MAHATGYMLPSLRDLRRISVAPLGLGLVFGHVSGGSRHRLHAFVPSGTERSLIASSSKNSSYGTDLRSLMIGRSKITRAASLLTNMR